MLTFLLFFTILGSSAQQVVFPDVVLKNAIFLALIFKEVMSSLFIGVFIGAATIGFYTGGVSGIFGAFFAVLDHYILDALMDTGHLSVILFSVLIGSIVAIISKNGGMQGVVNRLVRFAQTRKSGIQCAQLPINSRFQEKS